MALDLIPMEFFKRSMEMKNHDLLELVQVEDLIYKDMTKTEVIRNLSGKKIGHNKIINQDCYT